MASSFSAHLAALGERGAEDLPMSQLASLSRSIHSGMDQLLAGRDPLVLSAALAVLERCQELAEEQGFFSQNEGLDDVQTSDLALFLVPFVLAELLCSAPASSPAQRLRQVVAAAASYTRFLDRLGQYGMLDEVSSKHLQAQDEGMTGNPQYRREAKIERFKQDKEINAQLQRIEKLREMRSRRVSEGCMHACGHACEGKSTCM
jgi:hypothetical protein